MAEEVVDEVLWTSTAKRSFHSIIEYLENEWSDKEIVKFIRETEEFISALKRFPEMCRPSQKRKNTRIGILNRHTQIIYHYSPLQRLQTLYNMVSGYPDTMLPRQMEQFKQNLTF